jgi:hypothetical protein
MAAPCRRPEGLDNGLISRLNPRVDRAQGERSAARCGPRSSDTSRQRRVTPRFERNAPLSARRAARGARTLRDSGSGTDPSRRQRPQPGDPVWQLRTHPQRRRLAPALARIACTSRVRVAEAAGRRPPPLPLAAHRGSDAPAGAEVGPDPKPGQVEVQRLLAGVDQGCDVCRRPVTRRPGLRASRIVSQQPRGLVSERRPGW